MDAALGEALVGRLRATADWTGLRTALARAAPHGQYPQPLLDPGALAESDDPDIAFLGLDLRDAAPRAAGRTAVGAAGS